jgi:type II secretory pathway pseudopilin PulG
MVVVVLLGIAATMIMPRISRGFFASDIRLATRQVGALVRATRDGAVRTRRQHRLNYDLKEGTLWVTSLQPSGELEEEKRSLIRRRHWPGRLKLKGVRTQFAGRRPEDTAFTVFLPSGYVERTLLHLADGDAQHTLVIEPLTGAVYRTEGFVEEVVQ